MEINFLNIFDQFRFMTGTIIAILIFTVKAVPRRKNFWYKSVIGFIICNIISLFYLFILEFYSRGGTFFSFAIIMAAYWQFLTFISILYIMLCFEISICNLLFRSILGLALQQIVTVLSKYWMIITIYPEFPEKYPAIYVMITITIYTVVYIMCYYLFSKKLQRGDGGSVFDTKRTFITYLIQILLFSLISDITMSIFEWVLNPIGVYTEFEWILRVLRYFCIGVMLLICFVFFIIQYNVYIVCRLQCERELLKQLISEKKKQYEYSKENIEIIKQKCHDLKHQILALEIASDEERKTMIAETKEAVMIYDSVVSTDNDILNTILTEKSLHCVKHNIRISYIINTTRVDFINIIDLYTILGNALDNAIECVNRFSDDDKKTISLSIDTKGPLVCISTENYYEGKIIIKDGLPITTKQDKTYHGLGLNNIKLLVKKYGGDIRVSTEREIFSLQIVIPIP